MHSCDPNKQPSGHGHPELTEVDQIILDLDGTQCVVCRGGVIVAIEVGEGIIKTECRRCGNTGRLDLNG